MKLAISRLKTGKGDVSGQFTSDCFKAAPEIFSIKLSNLFKEFLRHGAVPDVLITCAH